MASVLKVDKLDPQSGTALEIGSSGDTITIPSGATFTQSGTMNASAITAGTIATARLGSGTASSSTVLYGDNTWAAAGGITAASQWRVTVTFSDSADPIASNWAVVDTDGYGSLGSAMSESSGVFTFPSTGYWLIQYHMWFNNSSADDRYVGGYIETTVDDGTFGEAASSWTNIPQSAHGTSTGGNCSMSFLFDVTSVSTHKCQFRSEMIQSTTQTYGSTTQNDTYVTFTRLGDT